MKILTTFFATSFLSISVSAENIESLLSQTGLEFRIETGVAVIPFGSNTDVRVSDRIESIGSYQYRKVWCVAFESTGKDIPDDLVKDALEYNPTVVFGGWMLNNRLGTRTLSFGYGLSADASSEELKSVILGVASAVRSLREKHSLGHSLTSDAEKPEYASALKALRLQPLEEDVDVSASDMPPAGMNNFSSIFGQTFGERYEETGKAEQNSEGFWFCQISPTPRLFKFDRFQVILTPASKKIMGVQAFYKGDYKDAIEEGGELRRFLEWAFEKPMKNNNTTESGTDLDLMQKGGVEMTLGEGLNKKSVNLSTSIGLTGCVTELRILDSKAGIVGMIEASLQGTSSDN